MDQVVVTILGVGGGGGVPTGNVIIFIAVQQKEKREMHVHSGARIEGNEQINPLSFMWGVPGPSSGCEEKKGFSSCASGFESDTSTCHFQMVPR